MGLFTKNIVSLLLFIFFSIPFVSLSQSINDNKVVDPNLLNSTSDEKFADVPELSKIRLLLGNNKLDSAKKLAENILDRPIVKFSSTYWSDFMKGNACYYLGVIEKNDSLSISFFIKAEQYGYNSYHQIADRLLDLQAKYPEKYDTLQMLCLILDYYTKGAELGDRSCMTQLHVMYKALEKFDLANYWFVIYKMLDKPESILEFKQEYDSILTKEAREDLDSIFLQYSKLSKPVLSKLNGLPNRTTLTAAFVEGYLSVLISKLWSSYFKVGKNISNEMSHSYKKMREFFIKTNPLCDVHLLINKKYSSKQEHFSVGTDEMISNILPGDRVLFNCGVLNHYAIVLLIDKENDRLNLVDPFWEFWQPTHNNCVQHFEKIKFKNNQEIISLKISEVKTMIIATSTVRDSYSK